MHEVKVFSPHASQLGECPLWEPDQNLLYWIDIAAREVHCLDEDGGRHRVWPLPAEPGCIARASGGLVVALRTGIHFLDTRTGALHMLAPAPYDQAKQRFNDGRCDAQGRLWVGSMHEPRDGPHATLYCFEGGRLRDVGLAVTISNGLAFSPALDVLYHADTTAHRVRAYPFDLATGSLGAPRLLRQFDPERGPQYGGRPDGAAVDTDGSYWVAMYEGARLLRLSPSGEVTAEFPLPVRCPTMPSFGGRDMRTIFVTSVSKGRSPEELHAKPLSGHVLSLRAPSPGRTEPVCNI